MAATALIRAKKRPSRRVSQSAGRRATRTKKAAARSAKDIAERKAMARTFFNPVAVEAARTAFLARQGAQDDAD